MARNYSNIALDTTLVAGIAAGDLSLVVASAAGWPSVPFAAVLDPGSLTVEEVVQVTNVAGTTFTITRGFDGTTAAAHALGATVRHAAIAGDFTDLQTADAANALAIANEASSRFAADALRLLITSYDWSTLPNKPAFGGLAFLSSITASLISDASANGRSLLTAADYAAMRTLLALVIGTNVQAWNADLDAIAALTTTAYGRSFLALADAVAARTLTGAQVEIALLSLVAGGTTHFMVPGVAYQSGTALAASTSANLLYYEPILVPAACTLASLAIEVTGAAGAGNVARLMVYPANSVWVPGALGVDAGTVAIDSTGVKEIAGIGYALAPGRYFITLLCQAAVTLRGFRTSGPIDVFPVALGSSIVYTELTAAQAYGAAPGSGPAIVPASASGAQFIRHVFAKITA